jgi:hypothetical protein
MSSPILPFGTTPKRERSQGNTMLIAATSPVHASTEYRKPCPSKTRSSSDVTKKPCDSAHQAMRLELVPRFARALVDAAEARRTSSTTANHSKFLPSALSLDITTACSVSHDFARPRAWHAMVSVVVDLHHIHHA